MCHTTLSLWGCTASGGIFKAASCSKAQAKVHGCTDPNAFNYHKGAEVNEPGVCRYQDRDDASTDVKGCVDFEAINYKVDATVPADEDDAWKKADLTTASTFGLAKSVLASIGEEEKTRGGAFLETAVEPKDAGAAHTAAAPSGEGKCVYKGWNPTTQRDVDNRKTDPAHCEKGKVTLPAAAGQSAVSMKYSNTCACGAGGMMVEYGRFCGRGYTGCPGAQPCDALDACCQWHDWCCSAGKGAMESCNCNAKFQECVQKVTGPGFCGMMPKARENILLKVIGYTAAGGCQIVEAITGIGGGKKRWPKDVVKAREEGVTGGGVAPAASTGAKGAKDAQPQDPSDADGGDDETKKAAVGG